MTKRITVTQVVNFSQTQIDKLRRFGQVQTFDTPPQSPDEWYERCKDADIICSGIYGLNSSRLYDLKDVFISVPFVGVEFMDIEKLKQQNILVSNSPGCNKEAVAEWMVGMMLMHFRRLADFVNTTEPKRERVLNSAIGLYNKHIAILGAGSIGSQLSRVCNSLGMQVSYFRRGDDLIQSTKDADIVANCLSANPSTQGLLGRRFFLSLKKGSLFISASRHQTYDIAAMIEALDQGILCQAIDDAANAEVGDVSDWEYKKLLGHPKIMATPHISWNTDSEREIALDMVIGNIEAWMEGKPRNLIY